MIKQKNKLKLTTENYYSSEANKNYMSCSQYQGFLKCEAAQFAQNEGRYTPPESDALFLGKYFHAYFEGDKAFEEFCNSNSHKIFKTKKATKVEVLAGLAESIGDPVIVGKYKPIEDIDRMIRVAQNDSMIQKLIKAPGENEAIMTGKLFGKYPWRIRLDKYMLQPVRTIIDWKTVADIQERVYVPGAGKEHFIKAHDYMMRAAVYAEIEKQYSNSEHDPAFWLVCISKQKPADKEIISMNWRQGWDVELEKVRENMPRIQSIKDGTLKPRRCGTCPWCRATKRLTGIRDFYDFEHENYEPVEEYEFMKSYDANK